MELPPDHHLPQEPLLPTTNMETPVRSRRYDEEGPEDEDNDAYRLTNQHHVIGDSDEEVERIDDDDLADRKAARHSGEERHELLGSDDRRHS